MNVKKVIALGLAAVMMLSTAGMTTYAEETEIIEIAEDGEGFDEESDSLADDNTFDADEDELASDDGTEDSEEAEGIFEDDEEDLEADGIEIESDDSADEEKESWLTLFTKEYGMSKQVIIFAKEDGSWADDKGNLFTKNDDGSWTDENGVVFYELDENTDPSLIEDGETASGNEEKKKSAGPNPETILMKMSKKTVKSIINSAIDYIIKRNMELGLVLGPVKTIIDEMFGLTDSSNPNQVILDKLDEIDAHLDRMEESLKEHMENVVALDSIGGDFQKVTNAISPLEDKIGDINGLYAKGKITEEERNNRLAAMYSSPEYNSLMQALSGATNAFGGSTSYTLDQRSIFGAAYNLQCNSVMFSGEAIDCVTPYLIRQLCIYLRGYALINTVLDAYEWINGTDATTKTRNTMFKNLGGYVNGSFDEKNPGVFGLYSEFFNTYRYTFVNKSSNKANHVRLSGDIPMIFSFSTQFLGSKGVVFDPRKYTPDGLKNFPLNSEQVKALAAYASSRHMTLYSLLFDTVGFRMIMIPNLSMQLKGIIEGSTLDADTIITVPEISGLQVSTKTITLGEYLRNALVYIPTGGQYIGHGQEMSSAYGAPEYNYIQGINANQIGAGDERLILKHNYTSSIDPNVMLLMAG